MFDTPVLSTSYINKPERWLKSGGITQGIEGFVLFSNLTQVSTQEGCAPYILVSLLLMRNSDDSANFCSQAVGHHKMS